MKKQRKVKPSGLICPPPFEYRMNSYPFFEEYLSTHAFFIAGGRTLEVIKKYEDDVNNHMDLLKEVAQQMGAKEYLLTVFTFDHEIDPHPALQKLKRVIPLAKGEKETEYCYCINENTEEGRLLREQIENDTPSNVSGPEIFAKRLFGTAKVTTNPDNLFDYKRDNLPEDHYRAEYQVPAASYHKYGEIYVVAVPRTVRGIFNQVSEDPNERDYHYVTEGYRYEWATPPDCQPISYSQVIALRENEAGDQNEKKEVRERIASVPPALRLR